MLCTSGFTDDVMFSYHMANEQNQARRTLCLEEFAKWGISWTSDKCSVCFSLSDAAPGTKSAIYDCLIIML